MNKFVVILIISFNLFIFRASAGNEAGNGGDGVYCKADPANGFPKDGLYFLDYAVMVGEVGYNLIRVKTVKKSIERIEKLLLSSYASIGASFQKFRSELPYLTTLEPKNPKESSKWEKWKKRKSPLRDIKDEDLITFLPPNCTPKVKANGDEVFEQIIVRRKSKNEKLEYHYYPPKLQELQATDVLQQSFAWVHEWLHEYDLDRFSLRRINYLLHTDFFQKTEQVAIMLKLLDLGLPIDRREVLSGTLPTEAKPFKYIPMSGMDVSADFEKGVFSLTSYVLNGNHRFETDYPVNGSHALLAEISRKMMLMIQKNLPVSFCLKYVTGPHHAENQKYQVVHHSHCSREDIVEYPPKLTQASFWKDWMGSPHPGNSVGDFSKKVNIKEIRFSAFVTSNPESFFGNPGGSSGEEVPPLFMESQHGGSPKRFPIAVQVHGLSALAEYFESTTTSAETIPLCIGGNIGWWYVIPCD